MTTRVVYQQELANLDQAVLNMGDALKQAIESTMDALHTMDATKAEKIMEDDDIIDTIECTIETQCIELIAKQAPIATDLRKIASYMRMIADVERIADHCSDISEYIIALSKEKEIPMPKGVVDMFEAMYQMTAMVIESFVKRDFDLAQKVVDSDDIIDDFFQQIKGELCIAMKHNPDRISAYVDYIMIIKYVERMGDHCTNIAKWIQFIISGELEL